LQDGDQDTCILQFDATFKINSQNFLIIRTMDEIEKRVQKYIMNSIEVKQFLLEDQASLLGIQVLISVIVKAYDSGCKVIFAGNGGSAADAQHLAAEFVSRFEFDRPGLPSISLSTDTSMITAIGNDYGYENLFSRQLQAQSKPGDVFIGISTSGKSANILRAFEECKILGVTSVALCGLGGKLEGLVDYIIRVPSYHTPRIQECHILIGHIICAEVEFLKFGHLKKI
jgi:D-sedoheptulose 7-phosphate isomerase